MVIGVPAANTALRAGGGEETVAGALSFAGCADSARSAWEAVASGVAAASFICSPSCWLDGCSDRLPHPESERKSSVAIPKITMQSSPLAFLMMHLFPKNALFLMGWDALSGSRSLHADGYHFLQDAENRSVVRKLGV
ncbi:MAG: hypothetical protein WAO20_03805 [Acidobacteriota bacterium]